MNGTHLPWLFPLFFILFWLAVVALVSLLGGWSFLARQYPVLRLPRDEDLLKYRSISINACNYTGCVHAWINDRGLGFKPIWLFAFMHPPLFLPWEAIQAVKFKGRFFRYIIIWIGSKKIYLRGRLAGEVEGRMPEWLKQKA